MLVTDRFGGGEASAEAISEALKVPLAARGNPEMAESETDDDANARRITPPPLFFQRYTNRIYCPASQSVYF